MDPISIIQQPQTSLKQNQQLLINLAMQQAFHVLQLPMLELAEWLNTEIEGNPVLEIDHTREEFKERLDPPRRESYVVRNRAQEELEKRRQQQQESLMTASVSLYEHLMQQAPLIFDELADLQLAGLIIGHFNEKGYLDTPLHEIAPLAPLEKMTAILETIQTFDPPGVGAANLQDCLLLQLRLKEREGSFAYRILAEHFEDLIHNRLPHIAERLRLPIAEVVRVVEKEIAPLDLHPGYRFCPQPTSAILPDLFLLCFEGKWQIEVNTSFLPHFRVAPIYIEALNGHELENEEYFYLRRKLAGGRWLKRVVSKRNETLRKIGEFILKKQSAFFQGDKSGLVPLTLKEAGIELGVHESTVARTVSGKFVACPLGLFSLKSFFKQGVTTKSGQEVSNESLREILLKAIREEDKREPLSDEQLVRHFQKLGITCARRTITKYRLSLKIPPAHKRRKWV